MIVKWKTEKYSSDAIKRVECSRETEKAVWVLEEPWFLDSEKKSQPIERRQNKTSQFYSFHDTWEAAHGFLLESAERELGYARERLAQAQGTLGNVKGMRKPSDVDQPEKADANP